MFLDKLYKELDEYKNLLNKKIEEYKKNNTNINEDKEADEIIDKINSINETIRINENEIYALILDEKIDDFSVEFNTIKDNFKKINKNDINKELYDEYEKRSKQLEDTLSKLKDLKNSYNTKNILNRLKQLENEYNDIIKNDNYLNDDNLKNKLNTIEKEIKKEKNRINSNAYYKLINKKQNKLKNIKKDTREANKLNKDITMLKDDINEKKHLNDVKNELFTNLSSIKYEETEKKSLSEIASEGPIFMDEERIDPDHRWLGYNQAKNLGYIRDISDYIDIPEEVEEKESKLEKIKNFRENNPLKNAWKNLSLKAKSIVNKNSDEWEMIK